MYRRHFFSLLLVFASLLPRGAHAASGGEEWSQSGTVWSNRNGLRLTLPDGFQGSSKAGALTVRSLTGDFTLTFTARKGHAQALALMKEYARSLATKGADIGDPHQDSGTGVLATYQEGSWTFKNVPYIVELVLFEHDDACVVCRALLPESLRDSLGEPVKALLSSVSIAPAAQSAQTLPAGAPVVLQTLEALKSGETKKGSIVHFKVDRNVIGPQGQIFVRAGTFVEGEVIRSDPHGLREKPGKLVVIPKPFACVDGTPLQLRIGRGADDDTEATSPAHAHLLKNGLNVEIPTGTFFTAYVSNDTYVPKPVPQPGFARISHAASFVFPTNGAIINGAQGVDVSCALSPDDPGAFIRLYVDGQSLGSQMGNPSKLHVGPGTARRVGLHELTAEVTFSDGTVVKVPAVRFTLR